jgi:hypothetical protein
MALTGITLTKQAIFKPARQAYFPKKGNTYKNINRAALLSGFFVHFQIAYWLCYKNSGTARGLASGEGRFIAVTLLKPLRAILNGNETNVQFLAFTPVFKTFALYYMLKFVKPTFFCNRL